MAFIERLLQGVRWGDDVRGVPAFAAKASRLAGGGESMSRRWFEVCEASAGANSGLSLLPVSVCLRAQTVNSLTQKLQSVDSHCMTGNYMDAMY
jgi:hypothetical protein